MEQNGQNTLFILFIIIFFAAFIIFSVWLMRWQFTKADNILDNWAKENKFQILEKTNANFGDGPLGTRQSSSQVKYRIVVIDDSNCKKSGLVTMGSRNLGTLSEEITVVWDEQLRN